MSAEITLERLFLHVVIHETGWLNCGLFCMSKTQENNKFNPNNIYKLSKKS